MLNFRWDRVSALRPAIAWHPIWVDSYLAHSVQKFQHNHEQDQALIEVLVHCWLNKICSSTRLELQTVAERLWPCVSHCRRFYQCLKVSNKTYAGIFSPNLLSQGQSKTRLVNKQDFYAHQFLDKSRDLGSLLGLLDKQTHEYTLLINITM